MRSRFNEGLFCRLVHHCGEFGVGHRVGGACFGDLGSEIFCFGGVPEASPGYFLGWFCFGAEFAQLKRHTKIASDREMGTERGVRVGSTVGYSGQIFTFCESIIASIPFVV